MYNTGYRSMQGIGHRYTAIIKILVPLTESSCFIHTHSYHSDHELTDGCILYPLQVAVKTTVGVEGIG